MSKKQEIYNKLNEKPELLKFMLEAMDAPDYVAKATAILKAAKDSATTEEGREEK